MKITSPDVQRGDAEARTPPGQTLTNKWPVLHYGGVPVVRRERWTLTIDGLVERPVKLTYDQLMALPRVAVRCDIHCVTHWSRLDNTFEGVAISTLLALAGPLPAATHVMQHANSEPGNDWTTNVPLDVFQWQDNLLATHHDGAPLTAEHGGPVRAVVPRLYLWKGAKWISRIELTDHDEPGFWERNGYHMLGDPWLEQRFGW